LPSQAKVKPVPAFAPGLNIELLTPPVRLSKTTLFGYPAVTPIVPIPL
jgi:hypothetical protein